MPKAKLGSGSRFKALVKKLKREKGVTNPKGLSAYIMRKKYGKTKSEQLSRGGKKHHFLWR